MPSGNSAASTALASPARRSSASMPIQKTRADRGVGKKPLPRKLRSNPLLVTVSRALRISSNCCVSPMNFRVTCSDSSRTQRGSGANSRTPSMKRAMRWRISSAMSRATKRRMAQLLAASSKLQGMQRPTSAKSSGCGAPPCLTTLIFCAPCPMPAGWHTSGCGRGHRESPALPLPSFFHRPARDKPSPRVSPRCRRWGRPRQ